MATFSFTILDNPTLDEGPCAITLTPFEEKLLQHLPHAALDQLRMRMLYAVTSDRSPVRATRVLVQMALATELKILLNKAVVLSPIIQATVVCHRRKYIDIDADMQLYQFLFEPALTQLAEVWPGPYADLIRRYMTYEHPRFRMAALAAGLCLATARLIPDPEV